MVLAQELLDEMADLPDEPTVKLVDKQVVSDIIRRMPWKVARSRPYYDRIYMFFESDTVEGVGEQVYDFLKDQVDYVEEDDDGQWLSNPKQMLERGTCDCKGYSLFIAGVVDGLNRNSGQAPIDWCFRFVPSTILGTKIGHVFVVLDPGGQEVWVDPVLSSFNQKPFYAVKKDVSVSEGERVSGLSWDMEGAVVGSAAEQSILDQLEQYALGMSDAVNVSLGNQTLNTISKGVLLTASIVVPVIAAAVAVLKLADIAVDDEFGAGSEAGLLLGDITNNILTAPVTIVETLLNGRTFNSDQYAGAWYYYYYVLGQTKIKDSSFVTDQMVPAGLKWFMDRTGVFVSGREHILALIKGPDDYESYYGVNNYTTTNMADVIAGAAVAQVYFNLNGAPGSWANTVGVFDLQLASIAQQLGESEEQVSEQIASGALVAQGVTNEGRGAVETWQQDLLSKLQTVYQNPMAWVLTAAVVIGIGFLIVDDE
jgi:hypothetical protein